MSASRGSILNASSPLEVNAKSGLPMSQTSLSVENIEKLNFGGEEGIVDALKDSKELSDYYPTSWSDTCMHSGPTSSGLIRNKFVANAAPCESSLFSSSLSDIFSQKCKNLFHVY